jgi:dihydroxyacetone kinase-like predicted kinase
VLRVEGLGFGCWNTICKYRYIALKEIQAVRTNNASEVAWAAARGALLGGRGCSGMILSGF